MLSHEKDVPERASMQDIHVDALARTSCQQSGESSTDGHRAVLSSYIPSISTIDRTLEALDNILSDMTTATTRKVFKNQMLQDVQARAEMLFQGVLRAALPLLPDDGPIVLMVDLLFIPQTRTVTAFKGAIGNLKSIRPKGNCSPYYRPWLTNGWAWGYLLFHAALSLGGSSNERNTLITVGMDAIPSSRAKSDNNISKRSDEFNRIKTQTDSDLPSLDETAYRTIHRIRRWLDEAGLRGRTMLVVGDTGCFHSSLASRLPHGTALSCRMKADATVHAVKASSLATKAASTGSAFRMAALGMDPSVPTHLQTVCIAGKVHKYETKSISNMRWPQGARRAIIRVISAFPRIVIGDGSCHYKSLSYYFSTENDFPTDVILNAHLRRCMIEGIHRQIRNKVRESSQMLRNYEARLGLQTAIALALSRSKIMALGVAKNTYSSHIEA